MSISSFDDMESVNNYFQLRNHCAFLVSVGCCHNTLFLPSPPLKNNKTTLIIRNIVHNIKISVSDLGCQKPKRSGFQVARRNRAKGSFDPVIKLHFPL